MASEYIEKLRDPRWQKKRLEILERDEWACQKCFNTEKQLHVHHKIYFQDTEPWDIDCKYLVTLCESCHEEETSEYPEARRKLIEVLAAFDLFAEDIDSLANDLAGLPEKTVSPFFGDFLRLIRQYTSTGPIHIQCRENGCRHSDIFPGYRVLSICSNHGRSRWVKDLLEEIQEANKTEEVKENAKT